VASQHDGEGVGDVRAGLVAAAVGIERVHAADVVGLLHAGCAGGARYIHVNADGKFSVYEIGPVSISRTAQRRLGRLVRRSEHRGIIGLVTDFKVSGFEVSMPPSATITALVP